MHFPSSRSAFFSLPLPLSPSYLRACHLFFHFLTQHLALCMSISGLYLPLPMPASPPPGCHYLSLSLFLPPASASVKLPSIPETRPTHIYICAHVHSRRRTPAPTRTQSYTVWQAPHQTNHLVLYSLCTSGNMRNMLKQPVKRKSNCSIKTGFLPPRHPLLGFHLMLPEVREAYEIIRWGLKHFWNLNIKWWYIINNTLYLYSRFKKTVKKGFTISTTNQLDLLIKGLDKVRKCYPVEVCFKKGLLWWPDFLPDHKGSAPFSIQPCLEQWEARSPPTNTTNYVVCGRPYRPFPKVTPLPVTGSTWLHQRMFN